MGIDVLRAPRAFLCRIREPAPLGSRLLGPAEESPLRRRVRIQTMMTTSLIVANLIGMVIVVVLVGFVLPGPPVFTRQLVWLDAVATPAYAALAVVIGAWWGTRIGLHATRWARKEIEPTSRELRATFRLPARLTAMQALLWAGGFAALATLYGLEVPQLIPKVAFTIAFSGVVVCANCYLLIEFCLRPVEATALEYGPKRRGLGVGGRSVLAWVLGSGVPVAGLMVVAIFALTLPNVSTGRLAVTVLTLGGAMLVFGLLLTMLVVGSTVAPIRGVRSALARVERGDLDVETVVYDGTELGELQSGFNRMVRGLRDRERIRDLFGRHVGYEVAEAALAQNPTLGGEEREVAVVFVDIIGSTHMASNRPPVEVVALLNRFFAVVVDEIDRHDGLLNKFEGDAALAIFGAPVPLGDAAGSALAAGRAIGERLGREVPECQAGLGIAAGVAVAGNVGANKRFEYTVIGDPVNEAARLCELAKEIPGRVVASDRAVKSAGSDEAGRWRLGDAVTLRGRNEATRLAVPHAARDRKTDASTAEG